MTRKIYKGSAEITEQGIKKHFKAIQSESPIIELIWNGFDANASIIKVNIDYNSLGAPTLITITDNGDGIDFLNLHQNFERFNDSLKKNTPTLHGSQGRGRLSFHKLCHDASWYTKHDNKNALIKINNATIKDFTLETSFINEEQHVNLHRLSSGTCVELKHFHANLPDEKNLLLKLSSEFCWYLAFNSEKKLLINGKPLDVPGHELNEYEHEVGGYLFKTKTIRWIEKPTSERSYIYLFNSENKAVHKQASSFNKKQNFYLSLSVTSNWADTFSAAGDDIFSEAKSNPESEVWKTMIKYLNRISKQLYDDFIDSYIDQQISLFEAEGIFPSYKNVESDYAKWQLENIKKLVKTIYIAEPSIFNTASKKQKKILIHLLDRLILSNQNQDLLCILENVLELDEESLKKLSGQLKDMKLENIISTIEILHKRNVVIDKLKLLIDEHHKTVLETPDLQRIIENNTWLFGEQYNTLGMEEDTFTKIAKSLRDQVMGINSPNGNDLDINEDIQGVKGVNRQPDLFLARKYPTYNSKGQLIYKCILIEIKRPATPLNKTHLRQLEDYADIIKRCSEFQNQHLHFELILIGRKISSQDTEIQVRLDNFANRGEAGLVSVEPNMKRYVNTWYTIFDSFKLKNNFLLEKLKLERQAIEHLSKVELVSDLQATCH